MTDDRSEQIRARAVGPATPNFEQHARDDLLWLLAERARQADALEQIREWAFTVHGGTKSPADVWPGLRAALAAAAEDEAVPQDCWPGFDR